MRFNKKISSAYKSTVYGLRKMRFLAFSHATTAYKSTTYIKKSLGLRKHLFASQAFRMPLTLINQQFMAWVATKIKNTYYINIIYRGLKVAPIYNLINITQRRQQHQMLKILKSDAAQWYYGLMSTSDIDTGFQYVPQGKDSICRKIQQQVKMLPDLLQQLPDVEPTEKDLLDFSAFVGSLNLEGSDMQSDIPREKWSNVILLVVLLLRAEGWKRIESVTGITWGIMNGIRRSNKQLKSLIDAAFSARDDFDRERLRVAVLKRAVDGVREPIIGRVGKDQDGIVCHKRRYSDRLAEFALSKLDKQQFGETDKGNINTGQQIIYNIQGLNILSLPDADKNQQQPPEMLNAGNNPATIDMPDIDELL